MRSAEVHAWREAVMCDTLESEKARDFDTTISTFGHPLYALVATGDV
jgi:hypothetical protein